MDGWIIAACAIASFLSGGIGAWVGVSVRLAVHGEKLNTHAEEIKSLRESRHELAGSLQEHEARLHFLEKTL